jgi:hypothetical protein
MKKIIKIILLFFLFDLTTFSQIDSIISQNQKNKEDTVFTMQKSPWGAVLRSALVPGLGQIYNESYWKTPLIWGLAGWFLYNWSDLNKLYKNNKELYRLTNQATYKLRRDFYRDQRDRFAIYLGLLYFLNLVDAYVDAHLYDFYIDVNENENLQLNFRINIR